MNLKNILKIKRSKKPVGRTARQRATSPMADVNRYKSYHKPQVEAGKGQRHLGGNEPRRVQRLGSANQSPRGQSREARNKGISSLLRRRQLTLIIAGLVFIALAVGLTYVSATPKVQIISLGGTAPALHSASDYELAAGKLLKSSLANYNKLTIDTRSVTDSLKKQFPELQSVNISLPLLGWSPLLVITPSQPVATLQSSGSGTLVVDSSGFAIGDASELSGLDLPLIVDQTGLVLKRGQRVMSKTSMSLVMGIVAQLKLKKVSIESFILPKTEAQELDLRLAHLSYYIKFSTVHPKSFQQQIGDFLAIRDYLKGESITPGQYVDVRLSGRAYYK